MLNPFIFGDSDFDEVAMEAANFQFDTSLTDAALSLLEKIQEAGFNQANVDKFKFAQALADIIGVPIKLNVPNNIDISTAHSFSIKDNPLIMALEDFYGFRVEDIPTAVKKMKSFKGKALPFSIDRTHAKIVGFPQDQKYAHTVTLGRQYFRKDGAIDGITPRMCLASILHELGHIYAYYEWAERSTYTNSVLSGAAEAILGLRQETDKIKYIANVAEKTGGLGRGQEAAIMKARNVDQIRAIYMNESIKRSRADVGINIYNVREWEALADQYASRWGYGHDLALSLKFDHMAFGMISSNAGKITVETMSALCFACFAFYEGTMVAMGMNLMAIGFLIPGVVFLGLATILAMAVFASFDGYGFGLQQVGGVSSVQYDDPKRRIEVIRNDQIARLKATRDPATRKVILNEIKEVEEAIKVYPTIGSFNGWLAKMFGPQGRANFRNVSTQQCLEDLAQSQLNVAAAKL